MNVAGEAGGRVGSLGTIKAHRVNGGLCWDMNTGPGTPREFRSVLAAATNRTSRRGKPRRAEREPAAMRSHSEAASVGPQQRASAHRKADNVRRSGAKRSGPRTLRRRDCGRGGPSAGATRLRPVGSGHSGEVGSGAGGNV